MKEINKKGFTLIELLAVIVILAIIALISIPLIMGIVEDANKKSNLESARYYVLATEQYMMASKLKNENLLEEKTYTITEMNNFIQMSGTKPTGGEITIGETGVTSAEIYIKGYIVIYDGKTYTIEKDEIAPDGWKRWAQIAEIKYRNYENINELLADASATEKLIASNSAIDYMVSTPEILSAVVENNKLESFFNNKHALFKMTENKEWYTAIMNSASKDAYIALMSKIPKMTANDTCSDPTDDFCGIASASRSYVNTPPYLAFDDVTGLGNGWSTNGQAANASTQNWLMYEFNNNVQIMGYSFYLHNYGGYGCYYNSTSNIKIEYSLDGETWNTITEASLSPGTTHTIYFEETYTVKYMRVTVTGVNAYFRYTTSNDWQAINELDFFGVKVQ